jgi:hypothetical protein
MKPYYGLTGFKLNLAIAVIAGTDFALFGYDQVGLFLYHSQQSQTYTSLGGDGRVAYPPVIFGNIPTDRYTEPTTGNDPESGL